MVKKRFLVWFLLICIATTTAFSQTRTVTILSQKDNAPLIGAYVSFTRLGDESEKKQRYYLLSDANGVTEIPFEGDVLAKVSLMGFADFSDTVKAGASATFQLQPLDIPIEQVVVTAQYTPDDPRNSVYAVDVIPQEKIERQGATNLKDVLAQQTNIRISQDGVLGSSLQMQGLPGEQVKIMVDGVPVIGRVNGKIDLSQLNLNSTQRIEVIEGPVSAQYGTNALGGIINLISDYKKTNGVSARVNGYYESVGVYNADAGIGYGKNGHIFDFSGGRYFFGGYTDIDTLREKDWKPKEQLFGALKYGYGFKRLQFTAKADAFYEKITHRRNLRPPYYINALDNFYHTQRYNGSASVRGEILNDHYIDQIVAYNFYKRIKNTFFKDLTTLESVMTTNRGDQDTTRFDAYLLRGFVSRNRRDKFFNYQVGYDFNIETGSGGRIGRENKVMGDYAFFLSFNLKPVSTLAIQASARWAYNTLYNAPIAPSFNLRWKPIEQLVIRASYARGFRAPSLKELYLDFVDSNHNIYGNPDLKAEHSNNTTVSIDYVRKKGNHRVHFTPSFFFNDVYNLINLTPTYISLIDFTYTNVEFYQTMGGELATGYQFKDLSFEFGAGLTGRKTGVDESFRYSPDFSAQANYKIPKAEITVSVFNKFNGKQNFFVTNELGELSQSFMPAYNLLDISLNRKFWKDKISLTAGVKNLLDVNNLNAGNSGSGVHGSGAGGSVVAWGRTFFSSLKFTFGKKA